MYERSAVILEKYFAEKNDIKRFDIIRLRKYIKDNKLKTSNDPYEPVMNNVLNPVTSESDIPLTEESIATAKLQLGS